MKMVERFSWSCFVCLVVIMQIHGAGQPNPPTWPPSVTVYDDSMIATIQSDMDRAYTTNGNGSGATWNGSPSTNGGASPMPTNNVLPQAQWDDNGQFNNKRYAFLFKPGNYGGLNVYVGYYTSVIGLGKNPDETTIDVISCFMGNGGAAEPVCPVGFGGTANLLTGALNTFWRSIENFTTNPNLPENVWWPTGKPGMTWAVSQACPMRKVNIKGNLYLFQLLGRDSYPSGFSSGGFIADCKIIGTDSTTSAVSLGSQQQFFFRNCKAISATPPNSTDLPKPAFSNGVWDC